MDQVQNGMVVEGMLDNQPPIIDPNAGYNRADATIPPVGGTVPPTGNTTGQTPAPSFMDIIRKSQVPIYFSQAANDYNKRIDEIVANYNANPVVKNGKKIQSMTLPTPPGTKAFVSGSKATALIFSELNHPGDNIPTIAYVDQVRQSLKDVRGDVDLVNAIVVTPEDYCKADVMAVCNINTLIGTTDQAVRELSVDSFRGQQIEISNNPQDFNTFMEKHLPHGVVPRSDLKLVISANTQSKPIPNTYNNLLQQVAQNKEIIAAIGGYVTFSCRDPNGIATYNYDPSMDHNKFVPEVHISCMASAIQCNGIIPMLLSIAATHFIDHGGWRAQFATLSGSNAPNIGNLRLDPNNGGQPMMVTNLTERDDFIRVNCTSPILFIDVMEGRYRLPGLELYVINDDSARNAIRQSFESFFSSIVKDSSGQYMTVPQGPALPPPNIPPCTHQYSNYTGYIWNMGNTPQDSRWADYLNIVANFGVSDPNVRMLLANYLSPDDRVKIIRQFFKELTLHYVNQCALINPETLRIIQGKVAATLHIVNNNQIANTIDPTPLYAAAAAMQNNPMAPGYSQIGNPFGTVYGYNNGNTLY